VAKAVARLERALGAIARLPLLVRAMACQLPDTGYIFSLTVSISSHLVRRPGRTTPIDKEAAMRFMVLVPGNAESEAGVMPSTEQLEEMTRYNEELVKAGVMLAGEGLHPTSRAARVRFDGSERTIIDGPFTESKELIAGYWIWQCASREAAIDWLKRAPFDGGVEIELRPIFEAQDFGEQLTPELRDANDRLREQAAALQ
jgi:hypothetical protein